MEIGTKIRALRLERNLSQEDLATSLDISQTALHYIETGHSKKVDVLLRLSQKEDFEKLAKNTATEYIDSKFSYVKSSEGGYYNTGVYILYYDTDLTIKEAE